MKEQALALARKGIAVFPLRPNGKEPLGQLAPQGYRNATSDPETVASWWSQYPDANVGAVPGSAGYVVLDLDVGADKDGAADLFALELEHGDLPETYSVDTPSGGRHLWFRWPADTPFPDQRRLASGIDVRADAGYVVAPGSVTPKGKYRASDDGGPVELPATWVSAFPERRQRAERTAEQPDAGELDDPRDVQRAVNHAQQAAPAVEGNNGSLQTYKVACELRAYGLSEETCFRVMAEHYNPRCAPPWDADPAGSGPEALAARVSSAYRNARQDTPGEHSIKGADQAFADIPAAEPAAPADDASSAPDTEGMERKTRPHRFLTDDDVEAIDPPQWDMVDVLPRRSLIALYGAPGTQKSFLALDWAYHLAHGISWAGNEVDDPRRVLYVAGEGTTGLQKRLRAWRKHHERGKTDNLIVSPDMPRIADPDAWAEWLGDVREQMENVDLIVFDTLAYLTLGLEENSNSDMMTAVSRLNHLRESFNASVMVVHHSGKDGSALRGATAVLGACDTVFKMESSEAVPGQAVLTMEKMKDAEQWRSKLSLQSVEYQVGQDGRGRALTSLALAKGNRQDLPSRGEMAKNRAEAEQMEHRKADAAEAFTVDEAAATVRQILEVHAGPGHEMGSKNVAHHLAKEHYGDPTADDVNRTREWLRKVTKPGMDNALMPLVSGREDAGRKRANWFRLPANTDP